MNTVLIDMERADWEIKDRMQAAQKTAENDRLLDELGYSLKSELVRLTVVVIALGLLGALAWIAI